MSKLLKTSSVFFALSMLLLTSSCADKKENKDLNIPQNRYQYNDIIGEWNIFHIEIVKGKHIESAKKSILFRQNYGIDSLKLVFKKDSSFSINKELAGNWSFDNDSVEVNFVNNGISH